MLNREIKRIQNKLGKFLDPLGLFILVSLFVLPALAVLNLSPKYRADTNVLGTKSEPGISVVLVGGVHDFLKEEYITVVSDSVYKYQGQVLKREIGKYSKPILQITNKSQDKTTFNISGWYESTTGSSLSIIIDNKQYTLQDASGNILSKNIDLNGGAAEIIYLVFDTSNPIRFNDTAKVEVRSN